MLHLFRVSPREYLCECMGLLLWACAHIMCMHVCAIPPTWACMSLRALLVMGGEGMDGKVLVHPPTAAPNWSRLSRHSVGKDCWVVSGAAAEKEQFLSHMCSASVVAYYNNNEAFISFVERLINDCRMLLSDGDKTHLIAVLLEA